jgi:hypothetical protein
MILLSANMGKIKLGMKEIFEFFKRKLDDFADWLDYISDEVLVKVGDSFEYIGTKIRDSFEKTYTAVKWFINKIIDGINFLTGCLNKNLSS